MHVVVIVKMMIAVRTIITEFYDWASLAFLWTPQLFVLTFDVDHPISWSWLPLCMCIFTQRNLWQPHLTHPWVSFSFWSRSWHVESCHSEYSEWIDVWMLGKSHCHCSNCSPSVSWSTPAASGLQSRAPSPPLSPHPSRALFASLSPTLWALRTISTSP